MVVLEIAELNQTEGPTGGLGFAENMWYRN
jgi:hypothetical protein